MSHTTTALSNHRKLHRITGGEDVRLLRRARAALAGGATELLSCDSVGVKERACAPVTRGSCCSRWIVRAEWLAGNIYGNCKVLRTVFRKSQGVPKCDFRVPCTPLEDAPDKSEPPIECTLQPLKLLPSVSFDF